ncbi:Uncharacterised protein [Mycobacteroides abscessus subsp. massiliense]|nr:Uncharacterised protein [Mycobacteroides abscessus subsp. massiliense]
MSWISALPKSWSGWTSKLLSTLPRRGRMAWVALSRASLAEPPAESPSTRKSSFSRMSSLSQSVSLPGRTATPLPFFFSIFLTERIRACA